MKNELIKGGITLFILLSIYNFINYFFHFVMARQLSVEDYGILVVLMVFTHYFTIVGISINTTISRYTSKNFHNHGKLKDLLFKGLRKAVKVSALLYLAFIPVAIFFSYFLEIQFLLIALIGLFLFTTFLNPITRGILQGKKRFKKLGVSMCLEASMKLVVAVVLVFLTKSIYGATVSIIMGSVFGFFITLLLLKDITKEKRVGADVKGIYSYNKKTFIIYFSLILIFGLDVLLARRFFSPDIVGKYVVLSMIAKMIYFGTSSIAQVMFPVSSLMKIKDKNRIYKKSLFITISLCLIALFLFLVFPDLIIKTLFGEKYLGVSGILFFVGIAFSLRSVTNLNIMHKLSYGEIKNPWLMLILAVIGIVILSVFHQSPLIFVLALCFIDVMILVGTLFLRTKEIK